MNKFFSSKMESVCAVILAAGKGTRMGSVEQNKVVLKVGGKPIIQRNIEVLKNAGIEDIIVVVGFAKESVIQLLSKEIIIAEQKEALGTGHATKSAINKIPSKDEYVLVVYGDDAFWFTPEILNQLYLTHIKSQADITFCTTILENPIGLGRIIRKDGKVVNIVEEKVASSEQKDIQEINLGGFLINKTFLERHIDEMPKNPISGEYYLTDLIPIATANGANIETLTLDQFTWRGINTADELQEAEKLFN